MKRSPSNLIKREEYNHTNFPYSNLIQTLRFPTILTSKHPKVKDEPSQEGKKMITLHPLWFNSKRLGVWGEDSEILRRRGVGKEEGMKGDEKFKEEGHFKALRPGSLGLHGRPQGSLKIPYGRIDARMAYNIALWGHPCIRMVTRMAYSHAPCF